MSEIFKSSKDSHIILGRPLHLFPLSTWI
uniref:Uncharacterized protein n=1 Tax=Rhizophora mucronata TaxID=61149 RepID=A0A2P2ND91_RHIMU